MRKRAVLFALVLATAATAACGAPSAEDLVTEILVIRNDFDVKLTSWVDRDAETPNAWLYLDVTIVKNSEASLTRLTVLVQQFDAEGELLAAQRASIDVSDMDVRGLSKSYGLEVRPMNPAVDGVTLIVEPNPPPETWAEFPELERVRPRGQ